MRFSFENTPEESIAFFNTVMKGIGTDELRIRRDAAERQSRQVIEGTETGANIVGRLLKFVADLSPEQKANLDAAFGPIIAHILFKKEKTDDSTETSSTEEKKPETKAE